jgi:hypothetical protein
MEDTPEVLLSIAFARLSLLTQLMRLLLRERAAANNQTSEDILKWSEETKLFFERHVPHVAAEGYLTAAIDEFFNVLASEVRQDRENP